MEEAWRAWRAETEERTAPLGDILEYLAFSTYRLGDIHRALRLTNQLLDEEPGHPRGVGNKASSLISRTPAGSGQQGQ